MSEIIISTLKYFRGTMSRVVLIFFFSVTEYSDGPGISQRDVFRAVGI